MPTAGEGLPLHAFDPLLHGGPRVGDKEHRGTGCRLLLGNLTGDCPILATTELKAARVGHIVHRGKLTRGYRVRLELDFSSVSFKLFVLRAKPRGVSANVAPTRDNPAPTLTNI